MWWWLIYDNPHIARREWWFHLERFFCFGEIFAMVERGWLLGAIFFFRIISCREMFIWTFKLVVWLNCSIRMNCFIKWYLYCIDKSGFLRCNKFSCLVQFLIKCDQVYMRDLRFVWFFRLCCLTMNHEISIFTNSE